MNVKTVYSWGGQLQGGGVSFHRDDVQKPGGAQDLSKPSTVLLFINSVCSGEK